MVHLSVLTNTNYSIILLIVPGLDCNKCERGTGTLTKAKSTIIVCNIVAYRTYTFKYIYLQLW